jgi:endonuclease/exonuclease/phosphatase family metal-dependent hydrolase
MTVRFKLRVCTFNVNNLGRADNPDDVTYKSKLDYLTDVLTRVDADIAVIDEVRESESFNELADRLDRYPQRFLGDAPAANRRIQIGILSRLPLMEQGQWRDFPAVLPGASGTEVRLGFRRVMPWVKVELPDKTTLMAVAVHLKSRRAAVEETPESLLARTRRVLGRSLASLIRLTEAAGLRCRLDEVMDRQAADHYVVLGDFNDSPDSTALSLLAGLEDEDGSELEQNEARRLFPVSIDGPQERAFSYVGWGQRLLLDHILVSRRLSLSLSRARAESQLLDAERHRGHAAGYPRSDHAPVWAEFEPGGPE